MWWHSIYSCSSVLAGSEAKKISRNSKYRVLRMAVTGMASLILTSCGFTPLYGEHSANQTVIQEALETKVDPIPGRNGQILRTTLMDSLNPHSTSLAPNYHLIVILEETEVPVGIQRDRRITRYNIIEEANYSLKAINGDKLIDSGHVRMIGSYDAVDSDFATFAAKQDAIKRVMQEMGLDIQARVVAAFLKQHSANK